MRDSLKNRLWKLRKNINGDEVKSINKGEYFPEMQQLQELTQLTTRDNVIIKSNHSKKTSEYAKKLEESLYELSKETCKEHPSYSKMTALLSESRKNYYDFLRERHTIAQELWNPLRYAATFDIMEQQLKEMSANLLYQHKNRSHTIEVTGETLTGDYEHLKDKQGDELKSGILETIAEKISQAKDNNELDEIKRDFEGSEAWTILNTKQDYSLFSSRKTSSIDAFNTLVENKEQDLNSKQEEPPVFQYR